MSLPADQAPNYRWWREQAGAWKAEVEARKRHMPIYHLQEIFLADLMRKAAPARVLDFGCGFGRHLEYLDRIPGLEVHGFDQSAAMLSQLDWAEPAWREERLRLGDPTGRLPYDDGAFDVVLTVSVLIHVRPEDLAGLLDEIRRVARWQVIHVENNRVEAPVQTSTVHDGCWAHDLAGAWAGTTPGAAVEVLPKAFEAQDVYRVQLDRERPVPPVDPAFAAQLLGLDRAVSDDFRRLQAVEVREGRRRSALEEQTRDLQARVGDLRAAVASLEARNREAVERARDAEKRASEAEAERSAAVQQAQHAAQRLDEAVARAREAETRHDEAVSGHTRARERAREAELREAQVRERAREAEAAAEQARQRARAQAAERTRAERRASALEGDLREKQRELNWVLSELRRSMGL